MRRPITSTTAGKLSGKTGVITAAGQGTGRAAVADLPALDILFNCAGYVSNDTVPDCAEKDWDFSFAQHQGYVPTDPADPASNAATGRRIDHQHVLGRVFAEERAEHVCLSRLQGGRGR